MKQNTLKWLSCSLILLFAFSCKKEKGVLDDFDPGRFDFVCIWKKNGAWDTLTGRVSGPYIQAGNYNFRIKSELNTSNTTFKLIGFKNLTQFNVVTPNLNGSITFQEHTSDYLLIHFQSGEQLNGSFKLTRKD